MEDYRTGATRSRSRSRSPPPSRDYGAGDDNAYLDIVGHSNGQTNNYDDGAVHPPSAAAGPPPSDPVALYVGNLDYGEHPCGTLFYFRLCLLQSPSAFALHQTCFLPNLL